MGTLREISCGQSAKVVKVHGEGAVRRRIMDMGITKNTEIYIRKVAPLGDPIEVTEKYRDLYSQGSAIGRSNRSYSTWI